MPTTLEQSTRPEDRFVEAFQLQDGHTLNGSNLKLQGLRREAIGHFRALGLPGRKAEAWKYTNIEKVLRHPYRLQPDAGVAVTAEDVERLRIPGLDAHLLVLVNGRFAPALSALQTLQEGIVVTSFAEAAEKHADLVNRHFTRYADPQAEVFTALNTAFTRDGIFVYVPKHLAVQKPIHIVNVTRTEEDLLMHPRNLIVVEAGAGVRMIETEHSLTPAKSFTNAVTEFFVGPNARVEHYKIQDEGEHASQVNTLQVYQERDSVFSTLTVTLSGEVVRNNMTVLPDAENCETHLLGLFLGHGRMHVDNHTLMDHAKPHCFSNELYKGILDDDATGVFNGKVFVRRDAQQTNAYQSNKTILLTDRARMYAKPELEIYADDVKCSHGATTGQLDAEALFYLRSRGLSAQRARAMLLLAFARDVLEHVKIEPLRDRLDEIITARYHA